jgi:hypothetical protein
MLVQCFGGVLLMVSFIPNLDKIFCKKSLKSLALTAVMVSSLGLSLNPVNAQTVGPGCDPTFMKAMQQKAWMEAQREIMIAQATIAKPDTVFSLGCFGNFTNGFTSTVTFTGNNNYNYQSALNTYVSAAFNHSYGGGHYTGSNQANNTNCNDMQNLWNAARQANLDQPSKLLGTLQDIAQYDRGTFPIAAPLPTGYGAAGTAGTPLGTFYGAKVPSKSVGANFDDMNLFAGVTAPRSTLTNPSTCAKGIPTGILVDTNPNKPEIVCPNPGCVSNGDATPKCCDYSGGNCSQ